MEHSVNGGLKICSNGHGPLIKIAAKPIYGKKHLKCILDNQETSKTEDTYITSGTQGPLSLFKDDRRLTFDFLRQGQICVPMHLYRKMLEKSFSQNALKTNG